MSVDTGLSDHRFLHAGATAEIGRILIGTTTPGEWIAGSAFNTSLGKQNRRRIHDIAPGLKHSKLLDVPYDPAWAIEGHADAFVIRKPGLDYRHSKFIRQTFSELQLFNKLLRHWGGHYLSI